jgi:hypothetical protein
MCGNAPTIAIGQHTKLQKAKDLGAEQIQKGKFSKNVYTFTGHPAS